MKKIILLLVGVVFISAYLYYHYHSKKPFRCDAQMISYIVQDNSNTEVNLHATIIFILKNEGFIETIGSLKKDNQQYKVSRKAFFTIKPSELNAMNKTIITREVINPTDNTPEELWRRYILPETPGIEFYSEIKHMNNNAILAQGLSNPLFVCVR